MKLNIFASRLNRNRMYSSITKNAESVVNNILLNVKNSHQTPHFTKHIINCMVVNEIGVLSRVSGVLSGMGVNINSLIVSRTEIHDLSQITITVNGQDDKINRVKKQLEEIVPVWTVLDYTKNRSINREMLLIKVSFKDHQQQQSINELVKLFNAKVVDIIFDCMIIELTAKSDRIDSFIELIKPFGILEVIRSGSITMLRSYIKDTSFIPVSFEEQEMVDATLLPPG